MVGAMRTATIWHCLLNAHWAAPARRYRRNRIDWWRLEETCTVATWAQKSTLHRIVSTAWSDTLMEPSSLFFDPLSYVFFLYQVPSAFLSLTFPTTSALPRLILSLPLPLSVSLLCLSPISLCVSLSLSVYLSTYIIPFQQTRLTITNWRQSNSNQ